MIHPAVRVAISKVEEGCFDHCLKELQGTSLGISINCYVQDGMVRPMPPGMAQLETTLRIHVTDQIHPSAVQVGWFGGVPAICSGHPSCADYKYADDPLHGGGDTLAEAPELDPHAAALEAERRREMLITLHKDGLGFFLVHGHSLKHEFTELPKYFVAVVENGRTHFRHRKEVLASKTFVPTTWRMEDTTRQAVGGFIL